MTLRKPEDQDFEQFRRERQRGKQPSPTRDAAVGGYDNRALRELQKVEQREVQEQQLSRDVQDFFAEATRQAKSIVERVARDAEEDTKFRVEKEVEAFLLDALQRMQHVVGAMVGRSRGDIAETQVEASVGNLVGPRLDEFRAAGTAALADKHVGKDPFETDVEEVQRAFRERIRQLRNDSGEGCVPIDNRSVAMIDLADDEPTIVEEAVEEPNGLRQPVVLPPAPAPVTRTTANVPPAPAAAPSDVKDPQDLERFRDALKALVRQGTMTRDEAMAAWQTRVGAR